jgi:hypothetical protein
VTILRSLLIGLYLSIAMLATGAVAEGMLASASDLVEIRGTFIEGGVECPLFRAEDETTYSLTGIDRTIIKIGASAVLTGAETQFSTCQQGPTFKVRSVTLVED